MIVNQQVQNITVFQSGKDTRQKKKKKSIIHMSKSSSANGTQGSSVFVLSVSVLLSL
jgi:hypothetical protein